MKKITFTLLLCAVLFTMTACEASQSRQNPDRQETSETDNRLSDEENTEMRMKVQAGDRTFTAILENNAAADALAEMMKKKPVVIRMSDHSGFEKVGALGKSLPADNSQITTEPGDIVLYQGNQIVIFYGSNSWNYTRLGRIDDLTGWEEALGSGDVTVTFSMEENR